MNLPYNLTSYPNYLGHLSQRESSVSWESSLFPALVQTGCYQYLMFYACTLLVPKCDPVSLQRVPPCRSVSWLQSVPRRSFVSSFLPLRLSCRQVAVSPFEGEV